MDTARELGNMTLFEGLGGHQVAAFTAIAREVTFGPEDKVYDAGAAGDSLFVIVEGSFAVRVLDENNEEIDVAHLKAGSYFGEMEVIGGIGRTAAVVSEGDGRCYRFDAAELLALLKREDRLAAHFYERVCHELIRRLRNTTRDMGYFKARAL